MTANTTPETIARSMHDDALNAFREEYAETRKVRDFVAETTNPLICVRAFISRDCPFGHVYHGNIPYKTPYHR